MKTGMKAFLAVFAAFSLLSFAAYPDVNMGGSVVVDSGKTVESAVAFGGTVTVRGTVTGDAVAIGGTVVVEPGGGVRGDAVAIGGSLHVRDGASVSGDVVSLGGMLDIASGGTIGGERIRLGGGGETCSGLGKNLGLAMLFGPLIGVLGVIGTVVLLFFFVARVLVWFGVTALFQVLLPARVGVMADTVRAHFWKAFFTGLLCIVLIPVLLLLLLVSLIGIPLIPITVITLVLTYFYGSAGVALWAGRLFPGSAARTGFASLALGVLAIALLRLVPGVGFLLWVFLTSVSLGVTVLSRFGRAAAAVTGGGAAGNPDDWRM